MTGLAQHEATFTIARPGAAIGRQEPLPLAIRRMSVDLLTRSIADLRLDGGTNFDDGIHGARKKMKRLRGLIRLVRDRVGYRTYREENVVLRDTARTIAPMRDTWVLVETVRNLRLAYADLLDPSLFSTTEAWLQRRYQNQKTHIRGTTVGNAIITLATARRRFASFPIEGPVADDFDSIADGVERVYRRGLRGFRRSTESGSVEDLHEWRKRVKYLKYQMDALTPLQPVLIGSQAVELDDLGERLGHDHDLAVLVRTVVDNPDACPDDRERWLLMALAYERRSRLQSDAFRSGAALYGEKPKAFVTRLGAYWDAARH